MRCSFSAEGTRPLRRSPGNPPRRVSASAEAVARTPLRRFAGVLFIATLIVRLGVGAIRGAEVSPEARGPFCPEKGEGS